MALPWAHVLKDEQERHAFHSLLDEYFDPQRNTASTPRARAPYSPPSAHRPVPPAGLQTVQPTPRSAQSQPASSSSSAASTFIADQALQNQAVTSGALRQAGFSAGAAAAASKFGAQHHERLAPHVARAASSSFNQAQQSAAGPPPKGPKTPTGLSSSVQGFGKAMLSVKGPMSKEEARKNAVGFREPLATRQPVKAAAHAPPPMRPRVAPGLGKAKALYDYAASDESDLAVAQDEVVDIVERVSDEWLKCRNSEGAEGLVPASYVEMQT